MNIYTHSEPGGHVTNEDAIGVIRLAGPDPALICALSDGQGGRAGGARAAKIAVVSCLEKAQTFPLEKLLNPFTWQAIGEEADRNVSRDSEAGYATFIGLALIPSFVIGISCGDSAVALHLTDRFVELTENQYKNPPIGSGAARLTSFSASLEDSWKMLVVSDGVWKFTGWEEIIERCRDNSAAALISSLREIAVRNTSGKLLDDFSVILVES